MALKPAGQRRRKPLSHAPAQWSDRLYVRVEPARIALFRFLLEAHDNMALFTAVDPARGVLLLRFSPHQRAEVLDFLRRVRHEFPVNEVLDPGRLP